MATMINRENELQEQLNFFFKNRFGINGFYEKLTCADFVGLKKILSCINNVITLLATKAFVQKLYADGRITKADKERIWDDVNGQHANTNGFDVQYKYPERKPVDGIIAEVKCNIPVNGNSFGAAQIEGIEEDVDHLLHGKKKAVIKVDNYYKFMVILAANEHIQECVEKVFRENPNVKEYTSNSKLSIENVYVVYVSIDKA